MRTSSLIVGLSVCSILACAGCQGIDWARSESAPQQTTTEQATPQAQGSSSAPAADARSTQDKAVESGVGLLTSIATVLPPPWNVIVYSAASIGGTLWFTRRRRTSKAVV